MAARRELQPIVTIRDGAGTDSRVGSPPVSARGPRADVRERGHSGDTCVGIQPTSRETRTLMTLSACRARMWYSGTERSPGSADGRQVARSGSAPPSTADLAHWRTIFSSSAVDGWGRGEV